MYFENLILSLDDKNFRNIFGKVTWATVAKSLGRGNTEVQEKMLRNMSPRRANLVREMLPFYSYESAQGEIVKAVLYLQEHKYLSLDDDILQGAKLFLEEIAAKEEKTEKIKNVHTEDAEEKKPDISAELLQRIEEAVNSDGKLNLGHFGGDPDIAELEEAFNLLKKTPDLSRIKELTISTAYLKFAEPLFKLNALENLCITSTWDENNTDISDIILLCSNIKRLEIYGQNGELPDWLQQFRGLVSLEVRGNIKIFPDWIYRFDSLEKLKLNYIGLTSLPEGIGGLNNLTILDLGDNSKLKSLPDSIGQLSKLKNLNLYDTGIEHLPKTIGDLSSLEILNLDNTHIFSLPDTICNCFSLKKLSIKNTNLNKIPREMTRLSSLEELNLYGTALCRRDIPIEMLNNKNIRILLSYFLIPDREPFLYEDFIVSYKRIIAQSYFMSNKAWREGLLALEDELDQLDEGDFIKNGIRLVVDGTGNEEIKLIMTNLIENEKDHYKKILKRMAIVAILAIQSGENTIKIVLTLHAMANIRDNAVTAAIDDYFRTGNKENFETAFENLSKEEFYFDSNPEAYEIKCFIDKALKIHETIRRHGIEEAVEMITKGSKPLDVFDYGILMASDEYETDFIEKFLDNYSAHETEPAFQMVTKIKKSAVLSILRRDNTRILLTKLLSLYRSEIRSENFDEYFGGQWGVYNG
jgi:Leucine-rich repeat (LRR) protein